MYYKKSAQKIRKEMRAQALESKFFKCQSTHFNYELAIISIPKCIRQFLLDFSKCYLVFTDSNNL